MLLYLAPNRWGGLRQRPQHLVEGLARTRTVVFVEPAAHSLPGVLRRRLAGLPSAPLRARLRRVIDNLYVFSPAASLPWSLRARGINRLVHRRAWDQLRGLALPWDAPVDAVVGWPPAFDLVRWLRPRRLLYDCMDFFPGFLHGRRRRLIESLESELCRSATVVVTASRWLERRWTQRHPRVTRIPNGVELRRFLDTGLAPELPADLADIPRPRLGYVGTVGPWVDLPLLTRMAHRRPECSIVLIGPRERETPWLPMPANVHCLGERPYERLPDYLAALDVLLIPFLVTDLTRAVNPIKLYEYCATGKPIVATPIEDVVAVGDLCYVGGDADTFAGAIDSALREAAAGDPVRRGRRRALASASSWDTRVAALAELLADGA
jgi:glycosyltransferase involved in cell wall biosynthesis